MAFDIEGAKKAGYSEKEIADHLAQDSNFDIAGARKSGYSDGEILSHLSESNKPAQQVVPVQQPNIVKGNYEDVPVLNAPAMVSAPQPASSLSDKAIGATEAGIATVLGGPLSAAGQVYGSVKGIGQSVLNGTFGTNAGADAAEQEANKYGAMGGSVFAPSTPTGNRYLQNVGEAISPLAGLAPFTQEAGIIGAGAKAALPQAENAFNALSGRNQNRAIAERIAAGGTERDLAPYMLSGSPKQVPIAQAGDAKPLTPGSFDEPIAIQPENAPIESIVQGTTAKTKATKDSLAKEAIKQGYDDGLIQSLKMKNPETQREALKMVNNSETGKNNRDFGIDNRPADIAGNALAEKLNYIKKTKSDAGSELDNIADNLAGKPVDTESAVNDFISDLNKNGVKLDENNNPIYTGSKFEGDDKSQKILNIIIRRAKESSMTDAKGAHILKGYIDDKTNYGVSKEGLSGDAERIVKKFRAGIDGALDNTFDDYNNANIKYADTIKALNNFQDAAGGTVDLFGPNSDKALGTVSRRLLGNPQSRANLLTSLDELDNVAKKYGGDFKVNIKTLADLASELDRVHGAHASTSFLGETEKGTATGIKNAQRDFSNMTVLGGLIHGGAKTYDYARRITPQSQYKSLRDLLSRGASKDTIEATQ